MIYCMICGYEQGGGDKLCAICAVRTTREQQSAYRDGQRIVAGFMDSD